MSFKTIRHEIKEQILTITLNRPEQLKEPLINYLLIIYVVIAALKISSKCAFMIYKLRFFADFCLALTASQTLIRGSLTHLPSRWLRS